MPNWTKAHALWIAPLFACACAGRQPPPSAELCDARTAMARAEASPTRDRAPADVEDAREALAIAERAEASHPGTREAKDLAYLARRKAERARIEALYAASLEALAGARQTTSRLRRNVERQRQAEVNEAELARREDEAREAQRTALREALDGLQEIGATVTHDGDRSFVELPTESLFLWKRPGITEAGAHKLGAVVKALDAGPPTRLTVVVVEDTGGVGADAALLAQRRAERVQELLRERGIFSERMVVEGRAGPDAVVRVAVVEVRERPRAHEMSVARGHGESRVPPRAKGR